MKQSMLKLISGAAIVGLFGICQVQARTIYLPSYSNLHLGIPEEIKTLTHTSSKEEMLDALIRVAEKNPYYNALLSVFAEGDLIKDPALAKKAFNDGIEKIGPLEMYLAMAMVYSGNSGIANLNKDNVRRVETNNATYMNQAFNQNTNNKGFVSFDKNKALEFFEKAAELKSGAAMHFIGLYYMYDCKGFEYGIFFDSPPSFTTSKENMEKAVEWFTRALESGEPTLPSFTPHEALARIHLFHPDFKDMDKARHHIEKACEISVERIYKHWSYHPPKFSANALFHAMYAEGVPPFEKNEKKAKEYLLKGLQEGDDGNFYAALAFAYKNFPAEYLPHNENKVKEYLSLAMDHGDMNAFHYFFYIYLNAGNIEKMEELLAKQKAAYAKRYPDGEEHLEYKSRLYNDIENNERRLKEAMNHKLLSENPSWEEVLKILESADAFSGSMVLIAYAVWDSGIDTAPDPEKAQKFHDMLKRWQKDDGEFFYNVAEKMKPRAEGYYSEPDLLKGRSGLKEARSKYLQKSSEAGYAPASAALLIEELRETDSDMTKVRELRGKLIAQMADVTQHNKISAYYALDDLFYIMERENVSVKMARELLPVLDGLWRKGMSRHARLLCLLYEQGLVVEKNPKRAEEIYASIKNQKASGISDRGDIVGEQAVKIAQMTVHPRGDIMKNNDSATYFKYMDIAAKEGHGNALFELSCAYFGKKSAIGQNAWENDFLKELTADPAKAKEYLIKAGDRKNFRACAVLYIAYKDGIPPFEKDEAKANEYFKKGRQPFKDSPFFTDFLKDTIYLTVADIYLYGASIVDPNLDKAEEHLNSLPAAMKEREDIKNAFASLAKLKAKYWSEQASKK